MIVSTWERDCTISDLPQPTYPFDVSYEKTELFLGNKIRAGARMVSFAIVMRNNTQIKAMHDFWKNDCQYGTKPFYITLPMFGVEETVLMMFKGNYQTKQANILGKHTIELIEVDKALRPIYVVDDAGSQVVDDSGSFVVSNDILITDKIEIGE